MSNAPRDSFGFSNDYRQCAVAIGNLVKLFDPATRRDLATILGHTGEVIAVSFSADGKLLATTSLDNTIKIWDVSMTPITGRAELARTLSGMAIPVESAAFSGDGRTFAVSGANTVSLWELNTGAALRTITRPAVARDLEDLVHPSSSVFSADARFIAAQSGANEIKLWETRSGREVKSFPLSQGKKFAGAGVSPDGKLVALSEDIPLFSSASIAANPPANPLGGSASQPQPPQSATGFPQIPPGSFPSIPPDSTGDPKKDEKARKKADKEREKEMRKQQQEALEQMSRRGNKNQKGQPQVMMGGMDSSQLEKMKEQMEKAAQSGDIGRIMETASQMSGPPRSCPEPQRHFNKVSASSSGT